MSRHRSIFSLCFAVLLRQRWTTAPAQGTPHSSLRRLHAQRTPYGMALKAAWTRAPQGRMPPIEQAKLWALREVLRKQDEATDQYSWMATQVRVQGGGSPDRRVVARFFERVDADSQGWYPGKKSDDVGRPVDMTPAKRRAIALAAQGLKRRRRLPSYETVVAQAPAATHNPRTGAPFSRNKINEVLTTDCFDPGAQKPWQFSCGPQRKPLTDDHKENRAAWARRLRRQGLEASWCLRNVAWLDFCSKVIPGNPQKAFEQLVAGNNKRKRLMSPDAAQVSPNLGGSKTAEKQCSWGDTRVWYLVVLARGRLGVTVFTDVDEFPGETPLGAGVAVGRLEPLLRRMLGRDTPLPRTLFSDRGPGFYHRTHGTITSEYDAACKRHGFKPWAGVDATRGPRAQPADIADVLLHETAIAWLRDRLHRSAVAVQKPWEETPKEFGTRLQAVVNGINRDCDVAGLCREFPQRLIDLCAAGGDRLRK